ncbi:hypothetical protein HF984_03575 [Rothia terrae]|uniref:hypothetical protein n=1 Tax=Rothia terrae TaxID=396015 RepID=UPI0014457B06|nr:hypothetical protein [Rothia terrae]NKZ33857.1 hypothetical protein [Rothia terrae]
MKNIFTLTSSIIAIATMALTMTPEVAQASTFQLTPEKNLITEAWQQNPKKYGQATSPEECITGSGCAQTFENAVITWSENTGVQVLNEAKYVVAYTQAGGLKTLGVLESGSWNHSYCGASVTTKNRKNHNRWLVVLEDGKGTMGTAIDLNSEAGKKWKSERADTQKCFPTSEVKNHDWAENESFQRIVGEYADTIPVTLGKLKEPLHAIDDTLAIQRHEYGSIMFNKSTGQTVPIENAALDHYLNNRSEYGLPIRGQMNSDFDSSLGLHKPSIITWFASDANNEKSLWAQDGSLYTMELKNNHGGSKQSQSNQVRVSSATNSRPGVANLPEALAQSSIPHYVETLKSVDLGQAIDEIHPVVDEKPVDKTYYVQNYSKGYTVLFSEGEDQVGVMPTVAFKLALEKNVLVGTDILTTEFISGDGDKAPEMLTYFTRRGFLACGVGGSKSGFALRLADDQKTLVQTDWELAETASRGCAPSLTQSERPVEIPQELMQRESSETGPVDTTVDWSRGHAARRQQALYFFDNNTKERWIVAADSNGTPLPGARAFKTTLFDAGYTGPSYDLAFGNDEFKEWIGHWGYPSYTDMSLLGVPIAEEKIDFVDGAKILSQEFESGTLSFNFSTREYSINWNENGLAKKAWYDALNIK